MTKLSTLLLLTMWVAALSPMSSSPIVEAAPVLTTTTSTLSKRDGHPLLSILTGNRGGGPRSGGVGVGLTVDPHKLLHIGRRDVAHTGSDRDPGGGGAGGHGPWIKRHVAHTGTDFSLSSGSDQIIKRDTAHVGNDRGDGLNGDGGDDGGRDPDDGHQEGGSGGFEGGDGHIWPWYPNPQHRRALEEDHGIKTASAKTNGQVGEQEIAAPEQEFHILPWGGPRGLGDDDTKETEVNKFDTLPYPGLQRRSDAKHQGRADSDSADKDDKTEDDQIFHTQPWGGSDDADNNGKTSPTTGDSGSNDEQEKDQEYHILPYPYPQRRSEVRPGASVGGGTGSADMELYEKRSAATSGRPLNRRGGYFPGGTGSGNTYDKGQPFGRSL